MGMRISQISICSSIFRTRLEACSLHVTTEQPYETLHDTAQVVLSAVLATAQTHRELFAFNFKNGTLIKRKQKQPRRVCFQPSPLSPKN